MSIKFEGWQTKIVAFRNKTGPKNCPILIKVCVVIVGSLVYMYTNFRQNRTIFWPCFGRESQTRGTPIPNFWYFFTLNKIWKWVEFEKNQWLQSWCWFYSVSWNLGCGATPIWAAWDQKYFSHLINSQKCLMGPSFDKIPEIELPPVLMTWKICLLKTAKALVSDFIRFCSNFVPCD